MDFSKSILLFWAIPGVSSPLPDRKEPCGEHVASEGPEEPQVELRDRGKPASLGSLRILETLADLRVMGGFVIFGDEALGVLEAFGDLQEIEGFGALGDNEALAGLEAFGDLRTTGHQIQCVWRTAGERSALDSWGISRLLFKFVTLGVNATAPVETQGRLSESGFSPFTVGAGDWTQAMLYGKNVELLIHLGHSHQALRVLILRAV